MTQEPRLPKTIKHMANKRLERKRGAVNQSLDLKKKKKILVNKR